MTETEEMVLYDTLQFITENSIILKELIEKHGSKEHIKAYQDGIYRTCVRLQVLLGLEGIRRGQERGMKNKIEILYKRNER